MDKAGRAVGLNTRAAIKGVSFPVRLIADTGVGIADLLVPGKDLKLPSQGLDETLTKIGFPEPATGVERVFSDMYEGAGGGALFGPAAVLPGVTGAGSAGLAREAGAPGWAQLLAGFAGGAVPALASAAGSTIKSAGKVAGDMVKPMTKAGREQIVGGALRKEATNPDDAIKNMQNAPEFVPGSKPTSGVASKDPGLLGLERGVRNRKPSDFAEIDTQNISARNKMLDDIAGQPEDIIKAKELRTQIGDADRIEAFKNKINVKPENSAQIINEIEQSPVIKRDAVSQAMSWVKKKIEGVSDPEELYAIRQDIADAIEGKFDADKPALRLAAKQLTKVRDALDDDIELGAEGYQNYMKTFREQSKPITEMETLQDIRKAAEMSVPNPVTGERALSQAKWNNLVNKNRADNAKVLSKKQMETLDAIAADLDRGASLNVFKPSGSDTVQNLTMSNLLGSVLSGKTASSPFVRTLSRPLEWLYKIPEEDTQVLLIEAMKDPQTAALLMSKASAKSAEPLSKQLKRTLSRLKTDPLVGASQSQEVEKPKNP